MAVASSPTTHIRDCELVCVFAYHYPLREISSMKQKELLAFAKEAAKSMKTEKDLSNFRRMPKKVSVFLLNVVKVFL